MIPRLYYSNLHTWADGAKSAPLTQAKASQLPAARQAKRSLATQNKQKFNFCSTMYSNTVTSFASILREIKPTLRRQTKSQATPHLSAASV